MEIKQEPVGLMFCLDCMYKHSRDLEHHLEDAVRVTRGEERQQYEEMIDTVRAIRSQVLQEMKGSPSSGSESESEECPTCQLSNPGKGACPRGMERTDNYCWERIASKGEFDPESFRTIIQDEHRIVIGCPKGEWDPHAVRCKVGTKAQAILHPIGE